MSGGKDSTTIEKGSQQVRRKRLTGQNEQRCQENRGGIKSALYNTRRTREGGRKGGGARERLNDVLKPKIRERRRSYLDRSKEGKMLASDQASGERKGGGGAGKSKGVSRACEKRSPRKKKGRLQILMAGSSMRECNEGEAKNPWSRLAQETRSERGGPQRHTSKKKRSLQGEKRVPADGATTDPRRNQGLLGYHRLGGFFRI